jgi:hypothetical protein
LLLTTHTAGIRLQCVKYVKMLGPDSGIVDQQWPKRGEPDFAAFITAQRGKQPRQSFATCSAATSSSYQPGPRHSAISRRPDNRLTDGGEAGTTADAQALG